MAPVRTFRVIFHAEQIKAEDPIDWPNIVGHRQVRVTESQALSVQAAGPDFASIQTVLSNNGLIPAGTTLVLESVQEITPGNSVA